MMSESPKLRQALPWTDRFSVGVETLDADHRALVRLINEACAAMAASEMTRAREILDAICVLAEEHFRREEDILRGLEGYRDLNAHAGEHKNRLKQLHRLCDRLDAVQTDAVVPEQELVDWFVRQSIGHDAAIKAYYDDARGAA